MLSMKTNIQIYFLLSFVFQPFILISAQSISPEIISTSGSSFAGINSRIDFTIGELITPTLSNGVTELTQGFHQPEIHYTLVETFSNDFSFQLYPNPTEQFLTVETTYEEFVQLYLNDIHGNSIYTSSGFKYKTVLDLGTYAAGSYILTILDKSGVLLHKYIIIKKSTY